MDTTAASMWFREGWNAYKIGITSCPHYARDADEAIRRREWCAGFKAAETQHYVNRIRNGQD